MLDPGAPLVGYGEDGPVFERVCPKCCRYVRAPERISFGETWWGGVEKMDAPAECSRCGPVQLPLVGWGDCS